MYSILIKKVKLFVYLWRLFIRDSQKNDPENCIFRYSTEDRNI